MTNLILTALILALSNDDFSIRQSAFTILESFHDKASEAVRIGLASKDNEVYARCRQLQRFILHTKLATDPDYLYPPMIDALSWDPVLKVYNWNRSLETLAYHDSMFVPYFENCVRDESGQGPLQAYYNATYRWIEDMLEGGAMTEVEMRALLTEMRKNDISYYANNNSSPPQHRLPPSKRNIETKPVSK